MSVAEYIAAFVSIMIGLALADLAASLQRLLRAGRRVKWDLLTPLSALLVTAFVINVWWSMFASIVRLQSLTVGSFVPDLIALLLLFSLASSSLPDEVPAEGIDLGGYYRDNSRWFWSLFALYTGWVTLVIAARGIGAGAGFGAVAGAIAPNALLTILMLVLTATKRRWVHLLLVALLLAVALLAWLPQKLAQPGLAEAAAAPR